MFRYVTINDEAVWAATIAKWKEDAKSLGDEGVFIIVDVEQRLNRAKQQTHIGQNLHGYFLIKKGNDYASSLMEFSHAMPKSKKPWLKLLEITLQPSLLPQNKTKS